MKKLWKKIKDVFMHPARVLADAKRIVAVMRTIRTVLGTPAAQGLVNLIPGETDNRILEAVKAGLDTVLKYANAIEAINDAMPKDNPHMQNAAIHKTASLALRNLYPGMSEKEADSIVQDTYNFHG